jgi:hypothetical protein
MEHKRKVNVVEDLDGNKIVIIHDIRFKGKKSIEWSDVEKYLRQYVGEAHIVESTSDMIYIGTDLPDEFTHSNYTHILKGTNAKAKANAAQGVPEMIEIANEKEYEENRKIKHSKDAKFGWYSYVTRFALPVYGENGDIDRYNVFRAIVLVRHAEDNKLYLYDIIKIKKETSNLFQSKDLTQ